MCIPFTLHIPTICNEKKHCLHFTSTFCIPFVFEKFPRDRLLLLLPLDSHILLELLLFFEMFHSQYLHIVLVFPFAHIFLEFGRQFLQLLLPFFLSITNTHNIFLAKPRLTPLFPEVCTYLHNLYPKVCRKEPERVINQQT